MILGLQARTELKPAVLVNVRNTNFKQQLTLFSKKLTDLERVMDTSVD